MLALRGTLNAGLVKALRIKSSVPVPSSASITSIVLKRNQSTVPQSGTEGNGNFPSTVGIWDDFNLSLIFL
jgi:hypothetical protein